MIHDEKRAEDMTEEEAKEYCEEMMKQEPWTKSFVESSLKEGDTYRQIAYYAQNY